tara:strand:- start:993 stop:2471 length:1479 start_codon:yes stop_codon:yes gene_type:complete
MPIVPVPGGGGATTPQTYYNTPIQFGEYQFVNLEEIVENFMATYVGEGKILASTLKSDVNFHAHRALQELHYDTLRSCKSQEIQVCPSLKMPLPHDYVNYVKLTTVDDNGIEHIIYPTRHTSHPFAVSQDDDCGYEFDSDGSGGLSTEETCTDLSGTILCDATILNDAAKLGTGVPFKIPYQDDPTLFPGNPNRSAWVVPSHLSTPGLTNNVYPQVSFAEFQTRMQNYLQQVNLFCDCLQREGITPNCGTWKGGNVIGAVGFLVYDEVWVTQMAAGQFASGAYTRQTDAGGTPVPYHFMQMPHVWDSPDYQNWISTGQWPDLGSTGIVTPTDCESESSTWTSYSAGGGGNSIGTAGGSDPSVDNSAFFLNTGERYGIEPEHAQTNGSWYIDCMRGNIHFGSNLSGKTIILHYLSDGHGTDGEAIVPKLAEEAMYKWIAYGCLSARADVPENIVQRYKKEKFAETRKAKIRISNIKIEEISQIMRGKSKWIKH